MPYPTKKLEAIVDFQNGLWTGKKAPFVTAKVLRNTNFKNNDGSLNYDDVAEIEVEEKQLESRLLQNGDIILERSGGGPDQPVGRVVYFKNEDGNFSFSNFTTRIRVNSNKIDDKYLWFFLHSFYKSGKTELMQKKTTGIHNLTFSEYKQIEIPLPPLVEQKKIVAKLERVLGKISEAKKLRAEARENADNLLPAELHKIFTTPHHTHPYKLENVGMSSTGKNDWVEKELGEICEINPKKSEIKNKPDNLPVSFVPMAAVDEFSQEITSFDERKLGEVRKGYTYFRDGDVLFAKITPCMENGKVAIARNLKNDIGFGTTEFHVIRPKESVLSEWIYAIIRHPEFRNVAKTKMTGSAGQKRVPVHFLEIYKIPLPPFAEQKKIVARLDSLSEKIGKIKNLQSTTKNDFIVLEQAVLSKAFSGSI